MLDFDQNQAGIPAPRKSLASRWRSFQGLLTAMVLMPLVVYVGLLIAGLTQGFRSLVAEKLSDATGLPIALERTFLSPTLTIHIRGITTRPPKAELTAERDDAQRAPSPKVRASLSARRATLRPGWFFRSVRELEVEEGRLCFVQNTAGAWQPKAMATSLKWMDPDAGFKLPGTSAPTPEVAAPPRAPGGNTGGNAAGAGITLRFAQCEIVWLAADGTETASLKGMDARIVPLKPQTGQDLTYVFLQAQALDQAHGVSLRGLRVELLLCEDRRIPISIQTGRAPDVDLPATDSPAPGPTSDVLPVQ